MKNCKQISFEKYTVSSGSFSNNALKKNLSVKSILGKTMALGLGMVMGLSFVSARGASASENVLEIIEETTEETTEEVVFEIGEKTEDRPELPPDGAPAMPGEGMGKPEGERPEMPNGEEPFGGKPEGEVPDKPDGEKPGGEMPSGEKPSGDRPEMPNGEKPSGERPNGEPPMGGGMGNDMMGQGGPGGEGGKGGPGGGNSAPTEYQAANEVSTDAKGESYASSASDENAVLVKGAEVSLEDVSVEKTGDSDGESADFYGINAAVLAIEGGNLSITGAKVNTDGAHANGIFSYGEGTSVTVSDSEIVTKGNNSGGIMTTGGASMTANNLTVHTSGRSAAAIRSDRGGGTVYVSGGSYTSEGVGSPAVYSTADIAVEGATLTAMNSEAVVIEGGNSVTLTDVVATGNDASLNGKSQVKTNVLIYQSMSGDAKGGNSTFTMTGGSMTSEIGCMFHVTNVTTTINVSNAELILSSEEEPLMVLSADSWGTEGSNGGHATVNFSSQEASGDIVVDGISSLSLSLRDASSYMGAINSANEGEVTVSIENGSTWTLTGDSYIQALEGDLSGVHLNGYALYIDGAEVVGE